MIVFGNAAPLGDIQADLQKLFALLPGTAGQTAAAKFNDFINLIRSEAEKGALQSVPTIKLEVKRTVTPYVYVALGIGGLSLLISIAALRRASR